MGLSGMDPEALERWVAASCEQQGVDVRISDPLTLSKVSALLGTGPSPSARAPAEREHAPGRD